MDAFVPAYLQNRLLHSRSRRRYGFAQRNRSDADLLSSDHEYDDGRLARARHAFRNGYRTVHQLLDYNSAACGCDSPARKIIQTGRRGQKEDSQLHALSHIAPCGDSVGRHTSKLRQRNGFGQPTRKTSCGRRG